MTTVHQDEQTTSKPKKKAPAKKSDPRPKRNQPDRNKTASALDLERELIDLFEDWLGMVAGWNYFAPRIFDTTDIFDVWGQNEGNMRKLCDLFLEDLDRTTDRIDRWSRATRAEFMANDTAEQCLVRRATLYREALLNPFNEDGEFTGFDIPVAPSVRRYPNSSTRRGLMPSLRK